jgi:DNA mismatch repair protein MutS2
MDDKSLGMLDFPKIKEILAEYASFSASRDLVKELKPLTDYNRITLLLKQTAEARHLLLLNEAYTVGSTIDIRSKVRLAALEGILDPPSLMEIKQTLAALYELRRHLKSIAEDCPLLWSIAEGIAELNQIEKDIAACLGPDGEILDTASPPSPISAPSFVIPAGRYWRNCKTSSKRRAAQAICRKTLSPNVKDVMSSS